MFLPVFAAEPNEPNEPTTELKYKMDDSRQRWQIGSHLGRGPIKPTHVAELFIKEYGNIPGGGNYGNFGRLLQTEISKSMTSNQKEFIKTSSSYSVMGGNLPNMPIGYLTIRLYAVSPEDAKKMAQAFIELLNERTQERIKHQEDRFRKLGHEIAQAKEKLPEKQKQFEESELKYKEIKDARYSSLTEEEAYEKPKETMLLMNKTLDALEIELAGIQEKLNSIEKYRQRRYAEDAKNFSRETLDKLDQMFVEQMIELSSAKARQQAALKIRNREKEFLDLFNQWGSLEVEVNQLKHHLEISENTLRDVESILADPEPKMLPPIIYQNTATIYPVRVEDKKQNDAIKVRLF